MSRFAHEPPQSESGGVHPDAHPPAEHSCPDPHDAPQLPQCCGVVTSVSSLPVTSEGSRALLGSNEVVQALLQGGARIEVATPRGTVTLEVTAVRPAPHARASEAA